MMAQLAAVQHHCPLLHQMSEESIPASKSLDLQTDVQHTCKSTLCIITRTLSHDAGSASAAGTLSPHSPAMVSSLASRLQSLNLFIMHADDIAALGSGAFTQAAKTGAASYHAVAFQFRNLECCGVASAHHIRTQSSL